MKNENYQDFVVNKQRTNFDNNKKNNIIEYFKSFDVPRWFGFVGLFIFFISYGFTINSFITQLQQPNGGVSIWFGIVDRFTNQSNWLLFVFTFFYVFYNKHQLLKGNGFLVSTMVYIFFTFIGYNVVLVGLAGYGYTGTSLDIASNVWLHVLCPIYFIALGILHMVYNPNQEPKKFWKTFLLGMIYPTIYMIYIVTIPFVYTSNVDALGNHITYSVYGSATNVKDSATSWAYILVMYLGFFPGSFWMFYGIWKLINKYSKKK